MEKSRHLKVLITLLRIAIGWHFLFEGVVKIFSADWTSYGYLSNTSGYLAPFYHWLASNPSWLKLADIFNMYGLALIGLGLIAGLLVKYAALSGTFLLLLYYFAYPPFGNTLLSASEGSRFIVDRNFIEAIILLFFVFSKERGFGLDALRAYVPRREKKIKHPLRASGNLSHDPSISSSRREILKNLITLPILGFFGLSAFRIKEKYGVDVLSGATIQINASALSEIKDTLPKGKIAHHTISRLILGGNLIGGWAHARDLIYVPSLFRAYNTEKKVYETLMLAEQAGIDTINIGFPSNGLMSKYKKMTGGRIKVISQVAPNMKTGDYFEQINRAVDFGADILQVQGNWCDWLVRDGRTDVIHAMLEKIRSMGFTAGLGAHSVEALIVCEEKGIIPDYYMKTMHHDNYWSAHPRENRAPFEVDGKNHLDHNRFHNNIFCLFPEKTIEFVNRAKIPVMGFKVLAAGAIKPEDGFRWAFENGADFICVGMFDFQIVNDVNITIDTLNTLADRKRNWYA